MNEEFSHRRPARSQAQIQRFRIGAVIAIALAVGVILWLALGDRGGSGSSSSKGAEINGTAVSVGQLHELAARIGHPVFWIGPQNGYTHQLESTSDGNVFIRYRRPGEKAGGTADLTVATYRFKGAYAAIQDLLTKPGVIAVKVGNAGGGVAETSKEATSSVHIAFPGLDYQIEVFAPTPGTAKALVSAGKVVAIRAPRGATGTPTQVSIADLKSLSRALGQPIYWVGPRQGYTYELTRLESGQINLRYLPHGANVGSAEPYLTVATYPYPKALEAIQGLTSQKDESAIDLTGGGLAVINKNRPTNAHLAYPGVDYEAEVFDPSPSAVQELVTSGRVAAVG